MPSIADRNPNGEQWLNELARLVCNLQYKEALELLKGAFESHLKDTSLLHVYKVEDVSVLEGASTLFIEMASTGIPADQSVDCAKLLDNMESKEFFQVADKCLSRLVSLPSGATWKNYVNLAQLRDGTDSASLYREGLRLLKDELRLNSEDSLRQRAVSILCSLVELYMTELCFEEDAEQICEVYVNEAVALCPESPEVWVTKANVSMSQCKPVLAQEAIEFAAEILEQMDELDPFYPSFETRLCFVKLLLEIASLVATGQSSSSKPVQWYCTIALQQCALLKAENDEDPQVYYLNAFTLWCLGDGLLWDKGVLEYGDQQTDAIAASFVGTLEKRQLSTLEHNKARIRCFTNAYKEFSNCIHFCEANPVNHNADEIQTFVDSSNQILECLESYFKSNNLDVEALIAEESCDEFDETSDTMSAA